MIRRSLHLLRRSIAAQIVVLTLLLLLLAGLLAIELSREGASDAPTIDTTYNTLQQHLYAHLVDNRLDVASFRRSDAVRKTMRSNPDFTFSFYDGRTVFGEAPGPLFARLLRFQSLIGADVDGRRCHTFSVLEPPAGRAGGSSVMFNSCQGDVFYTELRNIRRPVALAPTTEEPLATRLAQAASGNLVPIALLVLLVAISWLLLWREVRRIARAARDVDLERGDRAIPLDLLALEVRPLGRVVNLLAERLRSTYQRQQLFLAAAAHELRTPLAVLRVRAEALPPSSERREVVEDIRTLSHIANQLLDLTSVHARDDARHDFLLASTIEDIWLDMRAEAPGHCIRLRQAPGRDWLVRDGNVRLFSVAITNLLRNAVSVTPVGACVFLAVDDDGVITVRDEGPGIDRSILDRVFEPFVKYPVNRAGSGLGLAIVRAIVDFHRGTIAVSNGPAGGAIFTIDVEAIPYA